MHIRNIHIRHIKSIRDLKWAIPTNKGAGWHVVLGDNGAGKSTVLKAIAIALLGPREAYGLRQDWEKWVRSGARSGAVSLTIDWDSDYDWFSGKGNTPSPGKTLPLGVSLKTKGAESTQFDLHAKEATPSPTRHVWGSESGWFAASYGPFRRFAGGASRIGQSSSGSILRLNRHLSLFGEGIAMTDALEWLTLLRAESDYEKQGSEFLDALKDFINQPDFLPSGVVLDEITPKEVRFSDASGVDLPVEELSDGYRLILSMTFELLRQLYFAFGADGIFDPDEPEVVRPSGVVLIDEVDAHLHPTWQKRIGFWLEEHFPNVQFIVSTHSPLICQAAVDGSIMLLPRSGSDELPRKLVGDEFNRVVFGNVLDAYGTEAFGGEAASTRSAPSEQKHQRLAELNTKELFGKLTKTEYKERDELRAALPSAASTLKEE
jgi:hypothetical protein